MKITLSALNIDLYDSVLSLWQQCEGIGLSAADSKDCIRSYLERNPGMSFVAVTNGKTVGAVLSGHDGRRGYIHHLSVHPAYRKQGIGRRLVNECLRVLKDVGIQKCHIFIFNDNIDGLKFWESIDRTRRSDICVVSKTISVSAHG